MLFWNQSSFMYGNTDQLTSLQYKKTFSGKHNLSVNKLTIYKTEQNVKDFKRFKTFSELIQHEKYRYN